MELSFTEIAKSKGSILGGEGIRSLVKFAILVEIQVEVLNKEVYR